MAALALALGVIVAACGDTTGADTTSAPDDTSVETTAASSDTTLSETTETTEGSDASETTAAASGDACTITLADLDSGDVHAAHYAMQQGIVSSDIVTEVTVDYLALPALIQSTASDRYDVTSTSLSGVVFASVQGEVDLDVIAFKQAQPEGGALIYTAADSELESPEDLVGHTLGITSLGSTTTMATQMVLEELYGVDADSTTGEVAFAELDPPTLLNAVQNGDVDAAELFYDVAFQAQDDPELRLLLDKSAAYEEMTGTFFVGGAYVVRPETFETKADCITEFQRMLEESAAYYHENTQEVADALAAEGHDPEFLVWWADTYEVGATLDQEWQDAGVAFWTEAFERGFIPENPDPAEVFYQP